MLDDFAINCQILQRSEFDELIRAEDSKGALPRADDSRSTRIKFNIDNSAEPEVMISIYSDRSGPVPLYHGKFLNTVEVFPKDALFQGKGLDNLHFKFFDRKHLRICSQVQDGGLSIGRSARTCGSSSSGRRQWILISARRSVTGFIWSSRHILATGQAGTSATMIACIL